MAKKSEKSVSEEVIEEVNEQANAKGEEPETPAAVEEPESGKPAEEPPAPPTSIDLDGETFTLDQIREFRKSGLMQEDYTRKTMAVADERKALEAERKSMHDLLERYDSVIQRITGKEADDVAADDPSVTPAVRRLLAERDRTVAETLKGVNALRSEIQEREQAREEARVAGFIVQTADDEIRRLMKEAKVPDEWFDIYRDRIGNRDPDCADPISGQPTKQSIAAAIRKEFGVVHQGFAKLQGAPTSTSLRGLKPEPKPRSAVPAPKKEESPHGPRPKDAFDGAREEVMQALAAASQSEA